MNKHSIGKTIATLRKLKGWTQADLAKKLGVSDKAISKWESESGLPEISQLPAMATLFNVTIDYLMTGKSPESEIVPISKAELCAKKDDVSLAEYVKDLPNDENNKNITDYILQYQSLNVFKKLCEIDSQFIRRFKILDAINLAVISNSLSLLSGQSFCVDRDYMFTFENEDGIKSLLPIEDKEYFRNNNDKHACILPRDFFTLLVTDKRINGSTLNTLLSNQSGRKCVWYHAFPYMIDEAYKNGCDEMLRKLLDISRRNNSSAYETINPVYIDYEQSYDYLLNYFFIASKLEYRNVKFGLVRILERTIKAALENGNFEMVDEFNAINICVEDFIKSKFGKIYNNLTKCYIADTDEIRIAKLKHDKSVSQIEAQVQATIHNGIINIKELKKIANYSVIKNALYEYPIHPFEVLYKMYQDKEWRLMFEYAVNNDIKSLSDAIIMRDYKGIERSIFEIWVNSSLPYNSVEKFCINDNELYTSVHDIHYDRNVKRKQRNIQEAVNFLSNVRQRIMTDLANKLDKEKIIGELTSDYFYSELNKGNKELVIVKLCVRLEAILKCDYGYQGDFSEMLDRFCGRFNTYDDEDNNYDPYTPKMLNRLRQQRNGIVHSKKIPEKMTNEDIKQCIDYICSL